MTESIKEDGGSDEAVYRQKINFPSGGWRRKLNAQVRFCCYSLSWKHLCVIVCFLQNIMLLVASPIRTGVCKDLSRIEGHF